MVESNSLFLNTKQYFTYISVLSGCKDVKRTFILAAILDLRISFKMPKTENITPTWMSLCACYRRVISKEKHIRQKELSKKCPLAAGLRLSGPILIRPSGAVAADRYTWTAVTRDVVATPEIP